MDANIVIAAFLKDSTVRRVLALSLLDLFVPEFLDEELDRHMAELRRRAGLSRRASDELRRRLEGYLAVIPADALRPYLTRARAIMRNVDVRDSPYLAAALAIPCDGIWSDDLHLKRQSAVPCWTTKELVAALAEEGLDLGREVGPDDAPS